MRNYQEVIMSWWYKYKNAIIFTFIIGLLAYGYMFTNKITNHDDINYLYSVGATISSGRWGLWIVEQFPNYSMPWLNGILSVVLIVLSICLIYDIFKIQDVILQCVLGGVIISFPSLIGTFCYMFTCWQYAFSFLLSVLATRFFVKKSNIYGCISLIVSLSIYQGYIAVTATLLLVAVINDLISEQNNIVKDSLHRAVKYVVVLLVSLVIYYSISKAILYFARIDFNQYAQNSITQSITIHTVFRRIYVALMTFIYFLIKRRWGLINTVLSQIMHVLVGLGAIVFVTKHLVFCGWKKKLLLGFCVLLLPMSVNCIYLMVEEAGVHTLVLYSFSMLYVFVILLIEKTDIRNRIFLFIKRAIIVAMSIIIINNVWIANKVYFEMYLAYERAYSYYTSVMTQVIQTEGFNEECKLALIGWKQELVYEPKIEIEENIAGVKKSLLNVWSRNDFIKYYLGYDIKFASEEEVLEIQKTKEFKEMSKYPYNNSIKKIDNYVVVKFD